MSIDPKRINPLIMDKLESRDLPPHLKEFLREVLKFEKGKLDQDRPRYTEKYENLLNKYLDQAQEASDQD